MLNPLKYDVGQRREGARWWKFSHRPVKFPGIKHSEPHIETARFHDGSPFVYPDPWHTRTVAQRQLDEMLEKVAFDRTV